MTVQTVEAAFDPTAWLADFKAAGGCFFVNAEGHVQIGWVMNDDDQAMTARRHYAAIEHDEARRAAVRALFTAETI